LEEAWAELARDAMANAATEKAVFEELDLVRRDLDKARSEAEFLHIHAARAMTMAAAVADSRRHRLEATDQALWVPRAGVEDEKGRFAMGPPQYFVGFVVSSVL
jgi:hypothetical protein